MKGRLEFMKNVIMLENGNRAEACMIYDATKRGISDFSVETVSIFGDIKNPKEGWTVIKSKRL